MPSNIKWNIRYAPCDKYVYAELKVDISDIDLFTATRVYDAKDYKTGKLNNNIIMHELISDIAKQIGVAIWDSALEANSDHQETTGVLRA